jgi:hypothetical protein
LACSATGRTLISVPRLLLDATTDAAARDALDVHAEVKLRDRGDPLGELLGWALGLWTGEPIYIGECSTCSGAGCIPGEPPSWANVYGEPPEQCPDCDAGHVVGHPHTAAAAGALEATLSPA